jgi:hypothetical protein
MSDLSLEYAPNYPQGKEVHTPHKALSSKMTVQRGKKQPSSAEKS